MALAQHLYKASHYILSFDSKPLTCRSGSLKTHERHDVMTQALVTQIPMSRCIAEHLVSENDIRLICIPAPAPSLPILQPSSPALQREQRCLDSLSKGSAPVCRQSVALGCAWAHCRPTAVDIVPEECTGLG